MWSKNIKMGVVMVSLVLLAVLFLSREVKADNLLKNPGFEKSNFEGWDQKAYGNKEDKGGFSIVDVAHSGKYGAGIYAETSQAWFYLRQKFDIPAGKIVTFTAWVKTNSPKAVITLNDGFFWGDGDPTGYQRVFKYHSGSGKWEQLKISLKKEREGLTSVAIGFDYDSADAQMIIDDLSLEVAEEISKAPDKAQPVLSAEGKKDGGNVLVAQNLLLDPQIQQNPSAAWGTWPRKGQPEFVLDLTTGHNDNTSLKISSLVKGVDGSWLQKGISVEKGQTYDYSFWFRTEMPGGTVSLLVEFPSKEGVYMGQHRQDVTANGTEWTHVTGSFKSPITDFSQFEVWVNLDNAGTGTAWFDDFSLVKSKSQKPDIDFRIEQPVDRILSLGQSEIKCRITQRNPSGPSMMKYTAQVSAGSKILARASGSVGRDDRFTIPLTDQVPDGKLDITFMAFNIDGTVAFERTDIIMKQAKPARVSFGAHRELLVDGKPFFPILVCWPTLQDLKSLPANGINAFHIGLWPLEAEKSFFEEATRLGLMVMPEFSELLRRGQTDYDTIKTRVSVQKQEPSLLCYLSIDEPDLLLSPPTVVQRAYNEIKELDPNHPVLYSEPANWQLKSYQGGADIIAIDPYLIPALVGKYVTNATEELGKLKPVWIWIGVCPMEGMPEWPAAPSAGYVRNCAYVALASGAKGVMYFSYHFGEFNLGTSDLWQPLGKLNKEITRMAPYLLATDPLPIKTSDINVIAARFDTTEGSILLVANMSKDRPVDVTLDLPDVHDSVLGLFDGKKTECSGKLRLSLKPYDTAAYKIR